MPFKNPAESMKALVIHVPSPTDLREDEVAFLEVRGGEDLEGKFIIFNVQCSIYNVQVFGYRIIFLLSLNIGY